MYCIIEDEVETTVLYSCGCILWQRLKYCARPWYRGRSQLVVYKYNWGEHVSRARRRLWCHVDIDYDAMHMKNT